MELSNFKQILGFVGLVAYCSLISQVQASSLKPVDRANGICTDLVHPHGYQCEEYMVQTEDGFLLGMQRLYSNITRGPTVLYHGIDNGGDIWVLSPPGESLAFLLADAGYEVWIPSSRTTTFSYGHVSLKSNDKAYWDWSFDELSKYDLTAVLQALNARTTQKISYIGYSQASQTMFAALSEGRLAEYIAKTIMIAPVAYVTHTSSPVARLATGLNLGLIMEDLKIYEFNPRLSSSSGRKILEILCTAANICEKDMLTVLTGPNCCMDESRMNFINKYELQSTSVKNWNHLGQLFQKQSFTKFDYGSSKNMQLYGSKLPPKYDLSRISADIPMMLIHGGKDALSDPQDVYRILAELKKPPTLLFLPPYAHFDFVLGIHSTKDVYQGIVSFLAS